MDCVLTDSTEDVVRGVGIGVGSASLDVALRVAEDALEVGMRKDELRLTAEVMRFLRLGLFGP